MLKRAVEIDSRTDSPHTRPALFHLDEGRRDDALSEIEPALRANPERVFTRFVQSRIKAVKRPETQKEKP